MIALLLQIQAQTTRQADCGLSTGRYPLQALTGTRYLFAITFPAQMMLSWLCLTLAAAIPSPAPDTYICPRSRFRLSPYIMIPYFALRIQLMFRINGMRIL